MISEIFETLTRAVSGTPLIAVLASAAWGVLSVVLSPCHLASIPLIVGFIGEQDTVSPKRAFLLALLFSTGILATIALIGVATAAFGRMLGDLGNQMNYIVAVIFFVIGLHFLGVIPMPFSAANARMGKWRGPIWVTAYCSWGPTASATARSLWPRARRRGRSSAISSGRAHPAASVS